VKRGRGGHLPAAGGRGLGEAGDDDSCDGGQNPGKEHPSQTGDGAEIAIEQRGHQQAGSGGGKVRVVQVGDRGDGRGIEAGPEDPQKARKPDAAEAIESGAVKLTCQT